MDECDICKNKGKFCDVCCYNYEDYFEPLPDKEIEEIEHAEFRKEIQETLRPEKIRVSVLKEFREKFNLVRRFGSSEIVRYAPVQALETALMATNTHVLCYLPCEVPPELQGKGIIDLEDAFAEACSLSEWATHEYTRNILNPARYCCACDEFIVAGTKDFGDVIATEIILDGRRVFLNKKYLDLVMEAMGSERVKTFFDFKGRDLLLLTNYSGAKAVIMPLVSRECD